MNATSPAETLPMKRFPVGPFGTPRLSLALTLLGAMGLASCEGVASQPHETWPSEPTSEPTPEPTPEHTSTDRRPTMAGLRLPESDIPLAKADGPTPGPGSPKVDDPYQGWRTFRMGAASFQYPKDWSVQNTAYGLALSPPRSRAGDEIILVTANGAPGIQKGTDSRVGAALDTMIRSSMPAMRRSGRPQEVPSNIGSGGRFDYAGRVPDGRRAKGSVYVAVASGKAAAISIVAEPRRLEDRRPVIEQIFRSFESGPKANGKGRGAANAGPLDLDPKLIGMFAGEAIHRGEGTYVNTRLVYALGADGVLHYGAESAISASQRNGAGGSRWTAAGMTGGKVERGTWNASNGILNVQWDSGKVGTVAYGFEPDGTLALRDPFTRKLINIYSRVH